MKDAGHILRVNMAERRRRKSHRPVAQFETRVRNLLITDWRLLLVQTVVNRIVLAACAGFLATKGSLFELKSR